MIKAVVFDLWGTILDVENDLTPFADAEEILATLKRTGFKIGLLSNASRSAQEDLEKHGLLPYFDATVFAYDMRSRKPLPETFEAVLEALEVAPAEAVMVGDGLDNDIQGALAVGMPAVFVNRNGLETSILSVKSLADLPSALDKISS